jgi:esterase/lipase
MATGQNYRNRISKMNLHVEPKTALCDEKIIISLSGLQPLAKVKFCATMNFPWATNEQFESNAWFTADANGQLDVDKQKPDSGSYDFADSMGLIVSMELVAGKFQHIVKDISIDSSLFIDITAECVNEIISAKVERRFKNPELKSIKIDDEFVGELFYTEKPGRKTILALGGSDGNKSALDMIAAPLASHGFNVLSLSYFNDRGLPQKLSGIPLEYFEKVFDWIAGHPVTKGNDLYVFGVSKGGELALLLASRYSIIKKVVVFAPHAYCFQGIAFRNVSSWFYQGKPVPYIRIKNRSVFGNMFECMLKNKPFGYCYAYKKALDKATNKEQARIKIEQANADILLIAGKQDNIWNAYDGCIDIMNTLKESHYSKRYSLLSYEEAGHPFPLPYIIPVGLTTGVKIAPRLVLTTGGLPEGNARLQSDSWSKTLEFFRQ